jgi:hypothetical protein
MLWFMSKKGLKQDPSYQNPKSKFWSTDEQSQQWLKLSLMSHWCRRISRLFNGWLEWMICKYSCDLLVLLWFPSTISWVVLMALDYKMIQTNQMYLDMLTVWNAGYRTVATSFDTLGWSGHDPYPSCLQKLGSAISWLDERLNEAKFLVFSFIVQVLMDT